ncbi:O-antigen ligase family protein [Hymenobacter actinosclerus]|uniref:O-antigen ligase-related domain-containing protein n=1 Tax=Hymenobacter actinosclerus TaxID=82805 RepID=A0A1I0J3H3_9BACT|nr:O-antigen ligase family protein [Hymenobacter actinosclerus]SEU04346.1 hypothetical protein SAMN04487998_3646 [Hymenobacter actinosclerus]
MKSAPSLTTTFVKSRWLLPAAVAGAVAAGWLTGRLGILVPGALLLVPVVLLVLVVTFQSPRLGFAIYISYSFSLAYLSRHLNARVGLVLEGLLLVIWLAVLFHRTAPPDWRRLRNDLCWLALSWFFINLLELANPAGASTVGWFYEVRSSAVLWLLVVPLGFMVLRSKRDLNLFLYLVIGFSVFGALYGIKQKLLGPDVMEQQWLDQGGARTHVIWGQLRVFANYSEAAQYGSSQAHVALLCFILALGPCSLPKRLLLVAAGGLLLYGMLISGTRGAFYVLAAGGFVYLVLSKQLKVLTLGLLLAGAAFGVLKYTGIGNSSPGIFRLRTALDPNDPSLLVRLENQRILREYLRPRPLGGGVGVMGTYGTEYNAGKFLATIPPDSLFVKIWGQYGIVGLLIWLGMMLYILGKCAGIVWRLHDPGLRQKLLALTAGYAGILLCSYGNEIMNQMPSSVIVYVSWVFIFMGPQLDTDTPSLPAATPHG